MKSKEELIKQVIILSIILGVVIIVALILNINKKEENDNNAVTKNNSIVEDKSETDTKEIQENLKGLLFEATTNEEKNKESLDKSSVDEELKTINDEIINYKEIWNGDN